MVWVGKFETGYKGSTSKVTAEVSSSDPTKIQVKPNVYSWRLNSLGNFFKAMYNYNRGLDSHIMKNTEWGAVAYLSHSRYGINDEVRINNNSNYLTGYAANTKDASGSTTTNQPYNTETGYLASTTGNITGVYDMSGGSWEYVAGYIDGVVGSSGLTLTEIVNIYSKYIDVYASDSSATTYSKRILGDATGEMGPFIIHLEIIEITGMMIIRTLWTLPNLGSFAAAITTMAPMQASSLSLATLVVATATTALVLYF